MSETASLSIRVTQEGVSQTATALSQLSQAGGQAENSFGNLALKIAGFSSLTNLAVDAGRKAVSMMVDLGKESVTLAADFEKSRVTWGVLVGDMDKGSQVFDKLRNFANTTPLSFQAVNSAATTLKGFGVQTNDLVSVMGKLGDVAMGDNNKLQSLALVYGQVLAQGKAKTQDLYQFINAGVPIFQLLSQSMGVSSGEIKDLAADSKITFDEIEKALTKATSAGGQFYDMMDKTAETTSGKWSTAQDLWNQELAGIGNTLIQVVNPALDMYINRRERINSINNAQDVATGRGGDATEAVNYLTGELAKLKTQYDQIQKSGASGMLSAAKIVSGLNIDTSSDLAAKISYLTQQLQAAQWVQLQESLKGVGATNLSGAGTSASSAPVPLEQWQTMLQSATKDSENKEGFSSFDTYVEAVTDKADTLSEIYRSLGMNSTKPFVDAQNEVRKTLEKLIDLGYTGPIGLGKLKDALEDLEGKQYPGNKGWGDVKKTPWGPATTGPTFTGSSSNASWSDVTRTPWGPATDTPISPEVASYNRTASTMDSLRQQLADLANGEEEYGIAAKRAEGWTEEEIEAFKKLKDALAVAQALDQLKKGLEGIAENAAVDTFQSIGKALADSSSFGDSFGASISKIGAQCTEQIGSLATVAGLRMIFENPYNPAWWFLLGTGGIISVAGGFWTESNSSSKNKNTEELNTALAQYYLNAEAFNSSGRASASLTGYAKGGIPTLPGFHAYRNQIVTSPHYFGFASGGVFGEAGPEAAVPLVRTRSGNLGVETSGSSAQVNVNVHNYVGGDVEQSESIDANGLKTIDVYIKKRVKSLAATGELDSALGISRSGKRIGG